MKIKTLTLAILSGISTLTQAQLRITSDFRTLGEARHGYMEPAVDTSQVATFISQRSRISLEYKRDRISLKFGVQDVRVWGEDDQYTGSGTFGDSESLQTAETWMQYNFTDSILVKLGRQIWAYDEQRILSGRDRNQYGLFYDGALFSFNRGKWQADIGASFNNTAQNLYDNPYYTDKNRFQTLDFVYLKNSVSKQLDISAIGVATGYQDQQTRNKLNVMYTGGATATFSFTDVLLHTEGYYQTGKNNKAKDVSAYFITAHGSYKLFEGKLMPEIGADYFSGHDATNSDADYAGTDHSFDILYGARFKYYGNMNQFMFVGKPFENGGVRDYYATITAKPNKKNVVKAQYHNFGLTADYASATSTPEQFDALDKALGSEIDLIYTHAISKDIKASIGGGYLLPTKSLEYLKGQNKIDNSQSYYVWASLRFSPELFASK